MRKLISVQTKHIRAANKSHKACKSGPHMWERSCLCPVAQAVSDAFGQRCHVFYRMVNLEDGRLFMMAESTGNRISRYDVKGQMKPFKFFLTLMPA